MEAKVETGPRKNPAKPFLKWAGGKGRLLPQYQSLFPDRPFGVYHEPFLGGAAVFFFLQPAKAILSDANAELMNVYRVVRDACGDLLEELKKLRVGREEYYSIRALNPEDLTDVQRAARAIYLNRTCYNGLYRVNSRGRFNVPYGRYKNPTVFDEQVLSAASEALQRAELFTGDFAAVLERAQKGDFVYFDPPYHPLSRTANFTDYTADSFGLEEQRRLALVFGELDRRGCLVMLSNSDTPLVNELYKGYNKTTVLARRSINCDGTRRGEIRELVIRNY